MNFLSHPRDTTLHYFWWLCSWNCQWNLFDRETSRRSSGSLDKQRTEQWFWVVTYEGGEEIENTCIILLTRQVCLLILNLFVFSVRLGCTGVTTKHLHRSQLCFSVIRSRVSNGTETLFLSSGKASTLAVQLLRLRAYSHISCLFCIFICWLRLWAVFIHEEWRVKTKKSRLNQNKFSSTVSRRVKGLTKMRNVSGRNKEGTVQHRSLIPECLNKAVDKKCRMGGGQSDVTVRENLFYVLTVSGQSGWFPAERPWGSC